MCSFLAKSEHTIGRLLSASLQKSPKSVLLLGPRQVGKSTLIKALKPELEINLADEAPYLLVHPNYALIKALKPELEIPYLLVHPNYALEIPYLLVHPNYALEIIN